MRSEWVSNDNISHVLSALTPTNRLVAEICLATGLRVGDVLAIKTEQLYKSDGRFTVKEQKTGKSKKVRLPSELLKRSLAIAGRYYLFENRVDPRKHRTRQALFKDLKRAKKLFRIKENLSCHSLRKSYAVNQYRKSGDLKRVQKLLNHSDELVTMIYALADCI